jgi:assimilatory nitrate reductase catalytic subunit
VAIAAWLPAWKGELLLASRFRSRLAALAAAGGAGRYPSFAGGDTRSRDWLVGWCQRQGWQMQVAEGGNVWNLLAWQGES